MKSQLLILATITLALVSILGGKDIRSEQQGIPDTKAKLTDAPNREEALFAGGCFWCVEADFEKVDGVIEAISGYSGGKLTNPSYKQVASGKTRHLETVKVIYDPSQVSYDMLIRHFWRQIDPTDGDGQFVDRGYQYSPAIFVANQKQKTIANERLNALDVSGRYDKPLRVQIIDQVEFFPAEDYHQDYYKKNPIRYKFYRFNSGRDQYLKKVWGETLDDLSSAAQQSTASKKSKETEKNITYQRPDTATIKANLSPLEYKVTQQDGTEPPFENAYWDNKKEGIYVDIVSGEPLFSSKDKYDSKTGWPSFTKPLRPEHIVEKVDFKLIYPRTEVRSYYGDSHLGHVFNDGPAPTGKRYCINSAALKFISKENLTTSGYSDYVELFETKRSSN